ncbi:MAG: hypothetical protein JW785_07190 [Acidimicrobiia bacterium]|nr:hypothetical protein [Acidimicrobiia bacterium]
MAYTLAEGERELGSWTLNYLPPGGGRYTGKLVVTDRRLLFDARFDTSVGGVLRQLIIYEGDQGYLEIPKTSIRATEVRSGLLSKRVVVTLEDGSQHAFDYGMLSVKKVAEAIEAG